MNRPTMGDALRRLATASARHRAATFAATLVVMGGLGLGVMELEFEDDPFDALPTGNPHTEATHRFFDQFPGASYAGAVFFRVAPEKWDAANEQLPNRAPYTDQTADLDGQATAALDGLVAQGSEGRSGVARSIPGPHNITDEVYFRAHEEFWQFLQARVPTIAYDLTLSSNIKLVNYTNTGVPGVRPPDAAAFTMPDTSPSGSAQYASAWQGRYAASQPTIESLVSDDWTTVRNVYLFDPGDASLNQVGAQLEAAVAAYRDAIRMCDALPTECPLTWNVFHADEVVVDPRSGTAAASHLTQTTLEDVRILGPIVGMLLAGAFFLAFRRISTVAVVAVPMFLAGAGVLGAFGLVGLPIHSVSLLVFPILMGNGIDFAIHMASAYHNARLKGMDPIAAAGSAGEAAGTPLLIATLTTAAGMLLLVFAPNLLLAQLGIAILIGMFLLLTVSLTTLPAALTFTATAAETQGGPLGRILTRNARFWQRNRIMGGGIALALAAASLFTIVGGQEILVVGTPAAFFPEDDAQRQAFDYSNEVYFGGNKDLVTNVLVLEGDFTRPEAQAFLRDLEEAFRSKAYALDESVTSIHFAMNSWIQVRQGTAGAPAVLAQEAVAPGSTFPSDQEGIRDILDEMFATPLATYASFFVQAPDYTIGSLVIEMEQPSGFDDLEVLWDDLVATYESVGAQHPDHGFDIHIVGATSVGYLFAKEEIPYLQVAALVGLAVTGLLVLAIRRNLGDALTVMAVVGASGLWWTALLAILDIPLSITLVGPVVLIAAIGSDYALHLRYGLQHEGPAAWTTIGRAVVYSAATDIGAFLVFTQMRYGILQDATTATAAALSCCIAATLLVVPLMSTQDEARHDDPVARTSLA